jgi:hypothetical protein
MIFDPQAKTRSPEGDAEINFGFVLHGTSRDHRIVGGLLMSLATSRWLPPPEASWKYVEGSVGLITPMSFDPLVPGGVQ